MRTSCLKWSVVFSILALCTAGELGPGTLAQPLFTENLCAPGAGSIGISWVSLPSQTDMLTAEAICAAVPLAATVSQGFTDSPSPTSRWTFDCVTGICTSTQPIPEPGCAASACFCVERGEGVQVVPTAAAVWPINRCDTFESITLTAGFRRYLFSVPYSTFLRTANDLANYLGLPNSGLNRGLVTRVNCAVGSFTTCQAGSTACDGLLLAPGEAYRVEYPAVTAGVTFTNPVACIPAPAPAPATCPINDLAFTNQTTFAWSGPAGCALAPLYDAVRGDLACLRGSCAQSIPPLAPPCAGCMLLENNDVDTTAADAGLPAVGAGYWYHARVDGGSWNEPVGPTHCNDLDQMLAGGCP